MVQKHVQELPVNAIEQPPREGIDAFVDVVTESVYDLHAFIARHP